MSGPPCPRSSRDSLRCSPGNDTLSLPTTVTKQPVYVHNSLTADCNKHYDDIHVLLMSDFCVFCGNGEISSFNNTSVFILHISSLGHCGCTYSALYRNPVYINSESNSSKYCTIASHAKTALPSIATKVSKSVTAKTVSVPLQSTPPSAISKQPDATHALSKSRFNIKRMRSENSTFKLDSALRAKHLPSAYTNKKSPQALTKHCTYSVDVDNQPLYRTTNKLNPVLNRVWSVETLDRIINSCTHTTLSVDKLDINVNSCRHSLDSAVAGLYYKYYNHSSAGIAYFTHNSLLQRVSRLVYKYMLHFKSPCSIGVCTYPLSKVLYKYMMYLKMPCSIGV